MRWKAARPPADQAGGPLESHGSRSDGPADLPRSPTTHPSHRRRRSRAVDTRHLPAPSRIADRRMAPPGTSQGAARGHPGDLGRRSSQRSVATGVSCVDVPSCGRRAGDFRRRADDFSPGAGPGVHARAVLPPQHDVPAVDSKRRCSDRADPQKRRASGLVAVDALSSAGLTGSLSDESDPAGEAGGRIGCGTITQSEEGLARPSSPPHEELDGPFMPFRGCPCAERTQVPPPAGLRIGLPRIQTILAGCELPDHVRLPRRWRARPVPSGIG